MIFFPVELVSGMISREAAVLQSPCGYLLGGMVSREVQSPCGLKYGLVILHPNVEGRRKTLAFSFNRQT